MAMGSTSDLVLYRHVQHGTDTITQSVETSTWWRTTD